MSDARQPKIAISYRRDDTSGWVRALYDRLVNAFGTSQVFVDFDDIGVGLDFEDKIVATLHGTDVLVPVIGRRWENATDDRNRRRLNDPQDTVRVEVKTGLERCSVVVPVLVDGAEFPKVDTLPTDIQKLARLNAHSIGLKTFHRDVDELITAVQDQWIQAKPPTVAKIKDKIRKLERQLTDAKRELQTEQSIGPISDKRWNEVKIERKPFDAFLAFSRMDERIASMIVRSLNGFPRLHGRRLRMFFDTRDLVSDDYDKVMRSMIDNSASVILLASSPAAHSQYVDTEISHFLETRTSDRVITVKVGEGDLVLPSSFRSHVSSTIIDLSGVTTKRDPAFKDAMKRLAALLHQVSIDTIEERLKSKRRMVGFVVAAMLIVLVGVAMWVAAA